MIWARRSCFMPKGCCREHPFSALCVRFKQQHTQRQQKRRDMVIFGWVNVAILLTVMAAKRYAFTSLWCAYAAVASVIILGYFWKSHKQRPFKYALV